MLVPYSSGEMDKIAGLILIKCWWTEKKSYLYFLEKWNIKPNSMDANSQ